MCTNLNKMSIKDYFKYLYDEVMTNLKRSDQHPNTILSRIPVLCINNNQSIGAFNELDTGEKADFDIANLKRFNEFKFRFLDESIKEYLDKQPEDVEAWIYYAKNKNMHSANFSIELSLNILSQSLEHNSSSELLWIEYLSTYARCKKFKDYNEICLMAIDNCQSYEIFWKVSLYAYKSYQD